MAEAMSIVKFLFLGIYHLLHADYGPGYAFAVIKLTTIYLKSLEVLTQSFQLLLLLFRLLCG